MLLIDELLLLTSLGWNFDLVMSENLYVNSIYD